MKTSRWNRLFLLILVGLFFFSFGLGPLSAQTEPVVWMPWDQKPITEIGSDGSGSEVSLVAGDSTPLGESSLLLMPSGASDETKIVVPFRGAALADWANADSLTLDVLLPDENIRNPNTFFLGLADVTGGSFTWVEGVFGEASGTSGWVTVNYPILPTMQALTADHRYNVYLSFFYEANGDKTPLTQPIYLGHLYLVGVEQAETTVSSIEVWSDWPNRDLSTIGDDNTGSSVALGNVEGVPALMVTPGGSSEETKIAFGLPGADLATWANYTTLDLQVYLPESNVDNPNNFFLGMADVTNGGFTWIAGVFSSSDAQPGWNTISYPLHEAMRDLNAEHVYNLYFSFFKDNGSKIPLTEPFYLGTAALGGLIETVSGNEYEQEVADLLAMNDADFIDAVARATFDYFWLEANPENGLVKDRSTPDSVASIAAVGFALAALPIGVDRGWITYDEGYQRALTTLQTFTSGGVEGTHGFFYHFVNMRTGEREWSSELSSIDTALLVAGALVSGQYFADTEVAALADQLYANVEWDWMAPGGALVRMGWTPSGGYLGAAWDHFDESMILYALAIGSPTHPVPPIAWGLWDRPVNRDGAYIYLAGEPLFVYQYPLAFLDVRGQEDQYANYVNNTTLACVRNQQFAVDHSDEYATYGNGVWGLSASDGPEGYRAYGAWNNNHDGTVAPYAAASCLPFTPGIALAGMRAVLTEYGSLAWREYGFVSAINEDVDWYSRDHIGIDQGDILLNLVNAQDGFVWELFMANPNIQNAITAMGFGTSAGDYAVTPTYLAEVGGP